MSKDLESDEAVTDVLAAEEFGVPAPSPALTPEELDLPTDLVGDEPRDVLIAEEFAMPAPDEARVPPAVPAAKPRSISRSVIAGVVALKLFVVLVALRVRRRRRAS